MSNFTHIKVPYRARCIQYTGENVAEVLKFMSEYGYTRWGFPNTAGALYVEHKDGENRLKIPFNYWVRVGENNGIKIYSDKEFPFKYKLIKRR